MAEPEVDVSQLSESQQAALAQYTSVTNQEISAAVPILQRSQWNVEIAITKFFDGEPAVDPVAEARAAMAAEETARANAAAAAANIPHFPLDTSPLAGPSSSDLTPAPRVVPQIDTTTSRPAIMSLFLLPISVLWKITQSFAYLFGSLFPFLPRLLISFYSPLNRRATSSRSTRRAVNPRDTAARFIREFEEDNGQTGLPFFEGGYAQALDLAKKDLKFLLVLLQSDEHDDTNTYNKETLGNQDVVKFIKDHDIVLWGGTVQDSEAYQVSTALNCTKFPFACLIAHTPNSASSMSVITRIVGLVHPSTFIAKLTAAMATHSEPLNRIRTTRAVQAADRAIRDQQNSAYEISLARDRERARIRREEEEARVRLERETREREEAANLLSQKTLEWRQWRARSLPTSEPSSDVASARVSLRMSDGERLIKRFAADLSMEDIYAFVECNGVEAGSSSQPPNDFVHQYKFKLVSPMPRVVYEAVLGKTVRECLYPSANLIVESIEEDEDEDGE